MDEFSSLVRLHALILNASIVSSRAFTEPNRVFNLAYRNRTECLKERVLCYCHCCKVTKPIHD
uniref:Uncharacterized protein n=1 Tax=Helianthus annuus TaxID=4232 RepID=A0A251TEW3_HELAN